jgi:RNA polymerase sigma-70 factor (ECF subfamily)
VGAGFAIFLLLWAVARRTHLPQEVHSKEDISVRAQANGQSGQHEPLRADSGRASSVAGESDAFPVVLRRLYRQQYQCAVDEDGSAFIMRAASELLPHIRGWDTAEIRRYIIEHSGEEAVCLFVACLRFDEREEVRSLLCTLACDREVSPTVRIAAVMGMIIPESDEMQAPGATHPISEMVSVGLLSVKPGLVRRPEFARTLAQALDGNELLIIERSSILATTIWSEILAAADRSGPDQRERLDSLCRQYWKPVYAFACAAWPRRRAEAPDLTQAFFAYFLDKRILERMDPERGSFRRYLKRALRSFLIDAERHEAVRRPPGPIIPPGEAPAVAPDASPEEAYDRAWMGELLAGAMTHLRRTLEGQDRRSHLEGFRAYYDPPERPGYKHVAAQLGLKIPEVRIRLEYCRRILRRHLHARVRESLTDESDVASELKELGL